MICKQTEWKMGAIRAWWGREGGAPAPRQNCRRADISDLNRNGAFGVRELAPAFAVHTTTPKAAAQRQCRKSRTVPLTARPPLRGMTLRQTERWGVAAPIAKAAASRRTPKCRRTTKTLVKPLFFGGFQILLTKIPEGQHYRTQFPAPGPAGAGFAFGALSATLSPSPVCMTSNRARSLADS